MKSFTHPDITVKFNSDGSFIDNLKSLYVAKATNISYVFNKYIRQQTLSSDFNNHLVKVETLLYKLSGKQRVSVKWILPLLTVVMNNWKIYTGLYEIGSLLMISHSWRLVDLVNVQEVVTILRKMRDDLKLDMNTLL